MKEFTGFGNGRANQKGMQAKDLVVGYYDQVWDRLHRPRRTSAMPTRGLESVPPEEAVRHLRSDDANLREVGARVLGIDAIPEAS